MNPAALIEGLTFDRAVRVLRRNGFEINLSTMPLDGAHHKTPFEVVLTKGHPLRDPESYCSVQYASNSLLALRRAARTPQ